MQAGSKAVKPATRMRTRARTHMHSPLPETTAEQLFFVIDAVGSIPVRFVTCRRVAWRVEWRGGLTGCSLICLSTPFPFFSFRMIGRVPSVLIYLFFRCHYCVDVILLS